MSDATIDDVAERADVSKSTVSAVLNNRDIVKASTRRRVLDAIETLNYRPRGAARRGFGASRGRSIGFVTKETTNPYYAEVQAGLQAVAAAQNYLTFAGSSEGDVDTERGLIRQFTEMDVDGLVITPILHDQADLSHIFELKRLNIPFVLLENVRGIQAPLVDIDNVAASRRATEHLIALGHERIVHFAGPAYSEHTEERADGVRQAFSRSPLAFCDEQIVPVGDGFEDGYERALDYFKGPDDESAVRSTAVTCYNDLLALGVMEALRELGLRVPEDVSVVGFDDLSLLSYYPIPLTTIHVPKQEMGRRAATMLLDQIKHGPAEDPPAASLDAELIVRSSTGPPGNA